MIREIFNFMTWMSLIIVYLVYFSVKNVEKTISVYI